MLTIQSITDQRVSDIARVTGYSVSHVSRVLRGERSPSAKSLVAIARALGISTDELLSHLGLSDVDRARL